MGGEEMDLTDVIVVDRVSRSGVAYQLLVDKVDRDLVEGDCRGRIRNGKPSCVYVGRSQMMHRIIMRRMGFDWKMVDHINNNPFDNRRCNLREASAQVNCRNMTAKGYTKNRHGFYAQIKISGPLRFAGDHGHETDRCSLSGYGYSVQQERGKNGKYRLTTVIVRPTRKTEEEARADYIDLKNRYHDGIIGKEKS